MKITNFTLTDAVYRYFEGQRRAKLERVAGVEDEKRKERRRNQRRYRVYALTDDAFIAHSRDRKILGIQITMDDPNAMVSFKEGVGMGENAPFYQFVYLQVKFNCVIQRKKNINHYEKSAKGHT